MTQTLSPKSRRRVHALVREELARRGRMTMNDIARALDVSPKTAVEYMRGIDGVLTVQAGRSTHYEIDRRTEQ